MDPFSSIAGSVLRRAREGLGLTLRDVGALSAGAFKPSAVGGYERGERAVSLERFCALASLYEIAPDRLLAELLSELRPEGRRSVVIDLNRLGNVPEAEGRIVAELAHQLKTQRRDYLADVITLRSGDIEEVALQRHVDPAALLDRLRPALREPGS